MRILVTGGAGYIGSHAALRLLDEGHDVCVLDNLSRGNRGAVEALAAAGGAQFRFAESDLTNTDVVRDVMLDFQPDAVLHFAALAYVGESVERPLDYFRVNVAGAIALLSAMRAARVRKIVFSSTCATYGEPDPGATGISEATAQFPVNPYGETKLCVERLLRAECSATQGSQLAAIALRYFNVAGCDERARIGEDHKPETHLIPIALQVALGQRSQLTIFGDDYRTPDGTCIRDYVHVEDLIEAHLLALGALTVGKFRAWNIGTGRGHSVREVLDACRRITGHEIPAVAGARREGDPAALFADARAIERDLGWRARHTSLDTMVSSAWNWMRAHPRGYA
jgi:UDP-glucose 4-epimerase